MDVVKFICTKVDFKGMADVSTLPKYRNQGYGEAVVRSCIAKIIESGKIATCTTKTTNTPMINTALKSGFKIVEEA